MDFATDGGTTNDVTTSTPSGDPDYYVSFMVPFADVVGFLATRSITITDQSGLRYVSATATQSNSLNQDLGGVNEGVNSTSTWTQLGGFSPIVNAGGVVIPEPSASMLVLTALAAGMLRRRRAEQKWRERYPTTEVRRLFAGSSGSNFGDVALQQRFAIVETSSTLGHVKHEG